MHIAVVATGGSRGDVQPGIVLADALKTAGHRVSLCVTEDFSDLAATHGLDICPVRFNTRAMVESLGGIEMIESGKNPVRMFRSLVGLLRPLYVQTVKDVMPVLEHADLVLAHLGAAFCVQSMAERVRVPLATFVLALAAPTREQSAGTFPPAPEWLPFKHLYNRLTHFLGAQAVIPVLSKLINEIRTDQLGLPPHTRRSFSKAIASQTILHGISPTVIPRPEDWPERYQMVGYWFEPAIPGWTAPRPLQRFLDEGPPPIYLGFGSMSTRNPEQTTALLLEAVRRSGQRAILAAGWAGLKSDNLPTSIMMVEEVPHNWLFPRVSVAVHHGGAGTTAAAFRAGVPSIIVPHFADQYFWARRAKQLGVSPEPIARKKLTSARLAEALSQVATDRQMRQRAGTLAEKLQREDGVQRAVQIIEHLAM